MTDKPFATGALQPGKTALSSFACLAFLCALCLSMLTPALAKEAAPLADDPLTERRMLAITTELRCLVCQNQSIADSNADLANDFRREIRHLIEEGRSDNEIMEFMVARYGDFVRYRPPVKGTTILLWAGPGVLLLIGLTVLVRYLRRRNEAISDAALTPEEQKAAEKLLAATRRNDSTQ
ncbi:MAG: cytochrome c-type biogenesis protein CcmH [Azospira sp.]|jgi:cytochrome c-type biogenesis protein CcmH|nr:cytochrome c-type biogenesis protein CcmH [Azospira sp.]